MVGERVVALRRARGLSQAELARRARLPGPTLYRVEKGKRLPNALTTAAIVVGLQDVTADDVLGPICDRLRAEWDAA